MLQDRNYLRQLDGKTLAQVIFSQLHPTEYEVAAAEMLEDDSFDRDDELACAEKRADESKAEAARLEQKVVDLEGDLENEKYEVERLQGVIEELEAQLELLKPAA